MHLIFLLARIYPYWALPSAIVLAQLFFFFRRRQSPMQYSCIFGILLLVGGIFAWFGFRGDLHSDEWVRSALGE